MRLPYVTFFHDMIHGRVALFTIELHYNLPLVTSCRFLPEIQARPSVVDHLCSSPVASLSWVMYTRVLEVDLDMSP